MSFQYETGEEQLVQLQAHTADMYTHLWFVCLFVHSFFINIIDNLSYIMLSIHQNAS